MEYNTYMTLYDKLERAFMELAEHASPGNNWVIGENNRVPQKLATIAIKIMNEHQDIEVNSNRESFD